MKGINFFWCLLLALVAICCGRDPSAFQISSPNNDLSVKVFELDSRIAYQVVYKESIEIDTSFFAFEFEEKDPIRENLIITNWTESSFSETWEMPWGEQREVENTYNELNLEISETADPERMMIISFKVYDDGLGFRFEFPEQPDWKEATITDELTEFQLTGDHTAWWVPGDWDIYEHLYNTTKVSAINAIAKRGHENLYKKRKLHIR